jgi:hypothetical protein
METGVRPRRVGGSAGKGRRLAGKLALLGVAFLVIIGSGCGGSSDSTSPASLKGRLLPASAVPTATAAQPSGPPAGVLPPGVPRSQVRVIRPPASGTRFKVERYFEWKNPIDVVAQGFALPEVTAPSQGVDVLKKADFDAGAGEVLTTGGAGPRLVVDALEFKSAKGATNVRDWLHGQDLMQPCFSTCSESVSNLNLADIPGSRAAKQVPLRKLPPNAPPPFDHYAVEFSMGPYLYVGHISDGPGMGSPRLFAKGAKAYYDHVKRQ